MIATLSAIVYIASERQEFLANSAKKIQKGLAISRLDDEKFQIYNFCLFLPLETDNQLEDEDSSHETVEPFQEGLVYLIHAKFSTDSEASLHIVITTSIQLNIAHEDIPVSKPFVHLLGRTDHAPLTNETDYQVSVTVKPYVSSEHSNEFCVVLLHSLNGRLMHAFDGTRSRSLVHATGNLFIHSKSLYCEVLEYQFVSAKNEKTSSVTVPWKQTSSKNAEKSDKL